jgi:hypothetical protein
MQARSFLLPQTTIALTFSDYLSLLLLIGAQNQRRNENAPARTPGDFRFRRN